MKGDVKKMEEKVVLPEGISASLEGKEILLKGKNGELKKTFNRQYVNIEIKGNEIFFKPTKNTKREKKIVGSFVAHLKNMIRGINEPHKYTLKICSGHFPMDVSVNGEELIIKNFFGEKIPRTLKLKKGVKVSVDGDQIRVESSSKDLAGQVSADIEQLTRRRGYDSRIFQDGCHIISKDGKDIK